ncbi:MAG: iron-containing alcohol dehydrogenase [Pseudomonadota bacterium]
MSFVGTWSYPTAVRFGPGRIAELGEACAAVGISRPLFVSDRGLEGAEITARARGALKTAGLGEAAFFDVAPNPTEANLSAGVEVFKAGGHDGIVAFGGGSAMDLGKLIGFQAGQTRPVWDFEDIGDRWTQADADAVAPSVCVPTTAGTGAEVGRAAVLTDAGRKRKKILFHPRMMPREVIADPELTFGLPRRLTVGAGFDALAHCLEAYAAPGWHPMADGIALRGLRLCFDHLRTAADRPKDLEARSALLAAALMGATAFQKGLGAVHALSHPICAHFDTHHGMTNAVVMPAVLRFNREVGETRLAEAAACCGLAGSWEALFAQVLALRADLDVPDTLAGLGVPRDGIEALAADAAADPTAGSNPRPFDEADAGALYAACFEAT